MTDNTLPDIISDAIDPALALLPQRMTSPEAIVMLLAIGLQESRFVHRRQINGPARGFWQFERGGGVAGVIRHPASAPHMAVLCNARDVDCNSHAVYDRLEHDDVLAAGVARLLLWTDPHPLPVRDVQAWDLYFRTWRPGKPHRQTWDAFYAQAQTAVYGAAQ